MFRITGIHVLPHPRYVTRRHVSNNSTDHGTDGQRSDDDDGTDGDGRTENDDGDDGRRQR